MAITLRSPASLEIEDLYYINASVLALSAQVAIITSFPIERMGQKLVGTVKLLASFLEPTQPPVRVGVSAVSIYFPWTPWTQLNLTSPTCLTGTNGALYTYRD